MNHHGMFSFYYREARQAWTESPPNIMELPREDMPDSNSNISDITSPHSDMIHITSPPRSQRTQQRQSRPSRREQATSRMRLSLGSLENVDLGKALDSNWQPLVFISIINFSDWTDRCSWTIKAMPLKNASQTDFMINELPMKALVGRKEAN